MYLHIFMFVYVCEYIYYLCVLEYMLAYIMHYISIFCLFFTVSRNIFFISVFSLVQYSVRQK